MSHKGTQICFPVKEIKYLHTLRGAQWQGLIDLLKDSPVWDKSVIGFVLLMIRRCGCITCNSDSFRSFKGCRECGQQAILHYKGDDESLLTMYGNCVKEIMEGTIQ